MTVNYTKSTFVTPGMLDTEITNLGLFWSVGQFKITNNNNNNNN